jgi:hypothetical protein
VKCGNLGQNISETENCVNLDQRHFVVNQTESAKSLLLRIIRRSIFDGNLCQQFHLSQQATCGHWPLYRLVSLWPIVSAFRVTSESAQNSKVCQYSSAKGAQSR